MIDTDIYSSETREFAVSFPAMRGVQANSDFFVIMCPLRYLPRLFIFDEEIVPPELRAQRSLSKARIPELVRYISENRDDYVFSALTASIDGPMEFISPSLENSLRNLGTLNISLDSHFLINDGQHRRAAIEEALKLDPTLGEETIPIVIFRDRGLKKSQQMFSDLNRHAVKPARSIGVLFDHRDDGSGIVRLLVINSEFFRTLVDLEATSLSPRSRKLFTLSAMYTGTQALLAGKRFANSDEARLVASSFWGEVSKNIPEWNLVFRGELSANESRVEFIHSHAIALHALGKVGADLLEHNHEKSFGEILAGLKTIEWSRRATDLWEGRALVGGRVSKSSNNVTLTTNLIKQHLGVSLSPAELRIEDAHMKGRK